MILMWTFSSVCGLTIGIYLKYIPGNKFVNISIAGTSEIFADLCAGVLFKNFGPKWSFVFGNLFAIAGGCALIF